MDLTSVVRPAIGPMLVVEQPSLQLSQSAFNSSEFVPISRHDLPAIGEVKGTILFVDDNDDRYHDIAEGLADAGYNVYYVENGQEALERIDQLGIGILTFIISDFNMPVMDGGRFHRALRSREDGT